DSFHYAYRSFTGNFVFVARLLDVSNVGAPYGGLMVRLATTAGSRNIETNQGPTGSSFGTRRRFYDGDRNYSGNGIGGLTVPYYHKVVRYGDQLSIYSSPDNATWSFIEG